MKDKTAFHNTPHYSMLCSKLKMANVDDVTCINLLSKFRIPIKFALRLANCLVFKVFALY